MNDIFSKVLEMSYSASIVITIVLVFRMFMRKAPKIYSYMLWSVVLFRLIVPVNIESKYSVVPNNEVVIQNIGSKPMIAEKTIVTTDLSLTESQSKEVESVVVIGSNKSNKYYERNTSAFENNIKTSNGSIKILEQWLFWLSNIWFIGVVGFIIYGIISIRIFKKRLHNVQLYKENIYFADNISTAFVLGILSSKIYIPRSLDENELEYIVLHEQKHIKRRDYLIKLVSYIAVSIHWFNPLVWFAYFKSNEDMEMSCDESVIREMGSDIKKDYSNSLLTFATKEQGVAMPLAFGEVSVKARIKNVLNYKSVSGKLVLVLVLLVAITTILLMLNPVSKTTVQEVRTKYLENKFEYVNTENLTDVYINYQNNSDIGFTEIPIPEEDYQTTVNFINSIELNANPKEKEDLEADVTLGFIGKYSNADETSQEIYCFNESFTRMYIKNDTGKTDVFEVLNNDDVGIYLHSIYSSVIVEIDRLTQTVEKPSDVVLDFEELYNAKTLYVGDASTSGTITQMMPIIRTSIGKGIEITKTDNLNGLTWNIKRTDDNQDYVKELTESVLLAFILIDNIEYLNVNIDGVIETHQYEYSRETINSVYGEDIRKYGNNPKELEEFITNGYKIDNLSLQPKYKGGLKDSTILPVDYKVHDAYANGDYVEHGKKTYNQEVMDKFVEDVNNGVVEKSGVRSVHYNIKGQPIIMTFIYKKDVGIGVIVDRTREVSDDGSENPNSEPLQILTFEPNIVKYSGETTDGFEVYFVTNLDEITKETLENSDGTEGAYLYSKIVK